MANLNLNYFSAALKRPVNLYVYLPGYDGYDSVAISVPQKPYKTLYLLPGFLTDTDFMIHQLHLNELQRVYGPLAVVIPNGENSFYVDMPKRDAYFGTFVGQELVEVTRELFPLSKHRDETFIGGISMGGFGAILNGYRFSSTFGKIAAISPMLPYGLAEEPPRHPKLIRRELLEDCFGDLREILNGPYNPETQLKALIAECKSVPDLYLCCGEEDDFYSDCIRFHQTVSRLGAVSTFEGGHGTHWIEYWNEKLISCALWLKHSDTGFHVI